MEINKFWEETHRYVKDMGGITAVLRRISIQRIHFELFRRTKQDVEKIEFVRGLKILDFLYPIDLFTETGIKELRIPPHSCIEYKERIITDSIYRFTEFAKGYLNKYPNAKAYLIYKDGGELPEQEIHRLKKQKTIVIIQIEDFIKEIRKIAKINDEIINYEQDWKSEREAIISMAQLAFREDLCTFFLGAGVSMDAGGPSWDELLWKIMRRFKRITKKKDFEKINEWCGLSPIILGRYIASNNKILQDVSAYLKRYVLYNGVNEDASELIKSICEAVAGFENDNRVVVSGKVDSIITYNYDDLIELALEHRGISVARITYKGRNHRNEFPVFHVHGLISKEDNGIVSTPIIGEKEYHQMYKESYHWSNVEQLHALDRNTCFFIGMSMMDPNLRRLLDISRTGGDNECKHYAFLQRKPMFSKDEIEKNRKHFNTIEFQLSDLGVHVIWYEDHEEVPQIIRKIIEPMRYLG